MTRPEQAPLIHATQVPERGAALVLFPIAALFLFYCLPITLQQHQPYQFLPQLSAYAALLLWGSLNSGSGQRLGLTLTLFPQGLPLGTRRWSAARVDQCAGHSLPRASPWRRLQISGRYAACQDSDVDHATVVYRIHRCHGRAEFSRLSVRTPARLEALTIYSRTDKLRCCLPSIPFWWQPFTSSIGSPSGTDWCGQCCGSPSETCTLRSWPMQSRSWCCMV